MRWERKQDLLTLQWKDNKAVTMMTTFHLANECDQVSRRTKVNGVFRRVEVQRPIAISDYNSGMCVVDRSDQLLGKYNALRKTNKWWKTLFFHLIDIARVNSYILFLEWKSINPGIAELQRISHFNQLSFSEELVKQLGQINEWDAVPEAGI